MKKLLVLALTILALSLSGCGAWDRTTAKWTGYAKSCVEGVQYLQFTSGVTVMYNQDGTIKTCKK